MSNDPSDDVQIVTPTDKQVPFVVQVQTDFLNSKHCCCLIPLGLGVNVKSQLKMLNSTSKTTKKSVRSYAALALDSDGGAPLGFIQLKGHGMVCDLHTPKVGEVYVESLAVLPTARGKGVGRKLLQWGEDLAKFDNCNLYTLEVLNGNAAIRLYERFGFVAKSDDACEWCIGAAFVCCFMGRPYGCLSPMGAYTMEKRLEAGGGDGGGEGMERG
ncbi:hypothetical protein TrLO_g497 [Triparma laevis f. longispina]|nr:hypothetical protein TrLO_g497 [Triparma laevis f. longispina]